MSAPLALGVAAALPGSSAGVCAVRVEQAGTRL